VVQPKAEAVTADYRSMRQQRCSEKRFESPRRMRLDMGRFRGYMGRWFNVPSSWSLAKSLKIEDL
jgi:hypothetical protein